MGAWLSLGLYRRPTLVEFELGSGLGGCSLLSVDLMYPDDSTAPPYLLLNGIRGPRCFSAACCRPRGAQEDAGCCHVYLVSSCGSIVFVCCMLIIIARSTKPDTVNPPHSDWLGGSDLTVVPRLSLTEGDPLCQDPYHFKHIYHFEMIKDRFPAEDR